MAKAYVVEFWRDAVRDTRTFDTMQDAVRCQRTLKAAVKPKHFSKRRQGEVTAVGAITTGDTQ